MLSAYTGARVNAAVSCLSVCLSVPYFLPRASYSNKSEGGSTRRGQRTFRPCCERVNTLVN